MSMSNRRRFLLLSSIPFPRCTLTETGLGSVGNLIGLDPVDFVLAFEQVSVFHLALVAGLYPSTL